MSAADVKLHAARESASQSLDKLIQMHRRTIADIDGGKKFTRKGKDVTHTIRRRCHHEITQCQLVQHAIVEMGEGQIQHAADLCRRIQEHIPHDN